MTGRRMLKGVFLLMVVIIALLTAIVSFAGTITYTYDELNRLKTEEYGEGTNKTIIMYEYDKLGNRILKAQAFTITVGTSTYIVPYNGSLTLDLTLGLERGYGCISEVLLDGVSIGNYSTYTISNIKANHTITVIPAQATVKNEIQGSFFCKIQDAYGRATAIENTETIKLRAIKFVEDLFINDRTANYANKNITLQGGYDSGFNNITGNSTLKGSLTITAPVTIKNLIVAK